MPEGDTLRKAAASIAPLLVGNSLDDARVRGLRAPVLVGKTVEDVAAHGKHLVVTVAGGVTLHVHFGIRGRWLARPAAAVDARTLARAALVLVAAGVAVVVVDAPTVEVLRTAFVHAHPSLGRLGPDLLDETCDLDTVVRRARDPAHSARPVGEVLLDQRVAAGIGNIFKSEVLFLERVHPFVRVDALDDETLRRLYARARELLQRNIGPWPRTTTADRSRGFAPRRGMGRHWVYGRARRACFVCGAAIESRVAGEDRRNTFFCPSCQPAPSSTTPR